MATLGLAAFAFALAELVALTVVRVFAGVAVGLYALHEGTPLTWRSISRCLLLLMKALPLTSLMMLLKCYLSS